MTRGNWLVASGLVTLLCAALASAATAPVSAPASTSAPTSSTPGLTTFNGQIIDASGKTITLKGVALSGIEIGHTINGNLHQGIDSINQDYQTHIYRMKLLGFNAVRIEWSQNQGLDIPPEDFSFAGCTIASQASIQATLTPPLTTITTPAQLPFAPPNVPQGICSGDLPNDSTTNRLAYLANLFASEGFYVSLVYHSYSLTETPPGDAAVYNLKNWVADWVAVVKAVKAKGTATDGRLILDLMNEPDTYQATWNTGGQLPSSITTYYLSAMDALYPVCSTCLFFIQGTGQSAGPVNANYGDGYAILPGVDGPDTFFSTVLTKPYLNQVVIAPHVYCPSVTKATNYFQGQGLWDRLTTSFGTLNKAGYCSGTTCHVFAVVIGEFNVNFDNPSDVSCYTGLAQYMFNAGQSNDAKHNNIPSFYIWAWDADADLTFGNGGMVASDWRSINWDKVYALTGVERFTQGVNLVPWYSSAYTPLLSSDLLATPSPPSNSPTSPSGPAVQSVAQGIFNVSGVGVPPLDSKKQGWIINAIRDAVNGNVTTASGRRLLQTTNKVTFNSATITSIGDNPATNSSIVVLRMVGTAPGNTAIFASTVNRAIGVGAATAQLGIQNACPTCFWRIDVAPGTTVTDITNGSPSTIGGKSGTCQTKYGSFCLDGTKWTVGKIQGLIAGLLGGIAIGAAVTGFCIWWFCVRPRNTAFQGPKPAKAPAPESPATKLANQLKAENAKAKAKSGAIEMNATPAA